MDIRKWIHDYLTFTRKERIAVIVLLILIVLIWLFPNFNKPSASLSTLLSDSSLIKDIQIIYEKEPANKVNKEHATETDNPTNFQYDRNKSSVNAETKYEMFEFDPNSLSFENWVKLGIRDRTIKTIQNYLSKGGHFYKKEDLKKIYGFSSTDYERLCPFIKIYSTKEDYSTKNNKNSAFEKSNYPENIKYNPVNIDINLADSFAFISLPGIGSKLANRIIQFREKLGGFYSINQLAEVYALPDSTFQKIKTKLIFANNLIEKFNINTASKDEMKNHPYFKWALANAIVEYRTQHGPYMKIEDLLKINLISEEVLEKLKSYIKVQ